MRGLDDRTVERDLARRLDEGVVLYLGKVLEHALGPGSWKVVTASNAVEFSMAQVHRFSPEKLLGRLHGSDEEPGWLRARLEKHIERTR